MSFLKRAWSSIKDTAEQAVKSVSGNNNAAPKPKAQMGPSGDTGSRASRGTVADRRRQRRSRGRDSTIITARSEIGSRTLLG